MAIIAPDLQMFAVADGHGGAECAAFLQNDLPKQFAACNPPPPSPLELLELQLFGGRTDDGQRADDCQRAVMTRAFAASEREFFASHSSSIAAACGACVCAASLRGDVLTVAHVGDCRCVLGALPTRDMALLSKQPGTNINAPPPLQLTWSVRQLTVDHDCCNKREVDAVRSRSRDADAIRGGRVGGVISVTRSLGDGALKAAPAPYLSADPETCSVRLQAGDAVVLICSDGVHEHVSNATAVKVAAAAALQGLDPAEAVVRLAVRRACEAAGVSEREVGAMEAGRRRKILDDATCVCLLRSALLHRFEASRRPAAKGLGDGDAQSAAGSALCEANANKRQKQKQ